MTCTDTRKRLVIPVDAENGTLIDPQWWDGGADMPPLPIKSIEAVGWNAKWFVILARAARDEESDTLVTYHLPRCSKCYEGDNE